MGTTNFKINASAPAENRQAYALEVAASALEDIRDELKKLNSHFKGEAMKNDMDRRAAAQSR